jgi:hypothetical protein
VAHQVVVALVLQPQVGVVLEVRPQLRQRRRAVQAFMVAVVVEHRRQREAITLVPVVVVIKVAPVVAPGQPVP